MIGVPDERYGEELMAWVIPRGGASLDADGVRAFCQGKIAHYKVPRYVKFVDAFPMTVTGKVQKFKMRDQAIQELGLGPGLDEDRLRPRDARGGGARAGSWQRGRLLGPDEHDVHGA